MRPHPRIRKTVKWGGAAVSAGLLILWGVSGWWTAGWVGPSWYVGFSPGLVYISFADFKAMVTGEGFCHAPAAMGAHWEWLPEFYNGPVELAMLIPIWMLALATLSITIMAWRGEITARRSPNACRACGYDRAGLAIDAVCPECGATPSGLKNPGPPGPGH